MSLIGCCAATWRNRLTALLTRRFDYPMMPDVSQPFAVHRGAQAGHILQLVADGRQGPVAISPRIQPPLIRGTLSVLGSTARQLVARASQSTDGLPASDESKFVSVTTPVRCASHPFAGTMESSPCHRLPSGRTG